MTDEVKIADPLFIRNLKTGVVIQYAPQFKDSPDFIRCDPPKGWKPFKAPAAAKLEVVEPEAEEPEAPTEHVALKRADLLKQCVDYGLPTDGTNAVLKARITAYLDSKKNVAGGE